MKKLLSAFLLILAIFCLCSCFEEKAEKKDFTYGSDGITKIYTDESGKTLKTEDAFYKTVYEYNESGLLSKCSVYTIGQSEPFEYHLYEYDTAGSLTRESYYHTEKLREYTVYENGEDGKPTKATLYSRVNAFTDDFAVTRTTVYEYGEDGLLAKAQCYDELNAPTETLLYQYHASGKTKSVLAYYGERLHRTESYDENGNIVLEETEDFKTVNTYSGDGKLISAHTYNFSPEKSEQHSSFTYDKSGRRTGETEKYSTRFETTVTKYTLHENGRYAEAKAYDESENLLKHTYYNANGVNADKEIFYNSDGTKARMVEYNGITVIKITYYNADGSVSTAIP